ncbi:uncharacterized protein MELLADRAFT_73794 [Melampsora larici-populina 98AG31]|uniref:Uncharacterized protein n=1 Tax=Melampsora larici-populina (strain 98AG31 / pathotype 3-4-7) TaxID=747676 RepID=F4R3F6_MELLP|nr:uncharacterized protein MELLADRAFT_73794 [Melampsora larici-populina 98AG31]EGG13177.1 hypothetical protein MELLADRAFT_73794 [Melampsora larici-populina 98AG31]
MPWFAPVIKKNPTSNPTSSSSSSYQTNHHHINEEPIQTPPPPSSVARKIKEQGWYNSIRPKPSTNQISSHQTTSNYIPTPSSIAVADSPSLLRRIPSTNLRQSNPNSNLTFLKSNKKNQRSNPNSSRTTTNRPRTANSHPNNQHEEEEFGQLYTHSPKLNSLNQKNLQHHNETITILNHTPEVQSNHHHDSNQISNSIRSFSASSSKMTNSPNFSNPHHSTLLNHHLQSRTNQIHDIEVATQSLAIRLQELATANQDGLLDDEEYRILRQGLFDKMTANNHEPSVIDIGPEQVENFPFTNPNLINHQPHSHHPSPQSTYSGLIPTPLSPTKDASSIRRSLRSTNSTTSFIQSLFKRQPRWRRSKTPLDDEDQPLEESDVESNSPTLPIDAPPLLTRALHHRPELHRQASGLTHPASWSGSQPSTAGSQSLASSSAPSETSRSTVTRPKTSTRTSSSYSKTSRMLTGTTVTTTVVATTDQDHTSATVMRREISDLEYERGRVLETFDEMERAAIARWGGTERTLEKGEPVTRDRPTSFLAPLPSAASLRNGPKNRRQRGNTIVKSPVISSDFETIVESAGSTTESNENHELEKELEEIKRKRKAVEVKYGDRLEYLNAKLKGAMIRERSKG